MVGCVKPGCARKGWAGCRLLSDIVIAVRHPCSGSQYVLAKTTRQTSVRRPLSLCCASSGHEFISPRALFMGSVSTHLGPIMRALPGPMTCGPFRYRRHLLRTGTSQALQIREPIPILAPSTCTFHGSNPSLTPAVGRSKLSQAGCGVRSYSAAGTQRCAQSQSDRLRRRHMRRRRCMSRMTRNRGPVWTRLWRERRRRRGR
jgi:hypothetical protein